MIISLSRLRNPSLTLFYPPPCSLSLSLPSPPLSLSYTCLSTILSLTTAGAGGSRGGASLGRLFSGWDLGFGEIIGIVVAILVVLCLLCCAKRMYRCCSECTKEDDTLNHGARHVNAPHYPKAAESLEFQMMQRRTCCGISFEDWPSCANI
jgi:hypothetical protein